MLLTITTTHRPATDLGYLLHKHPERVQSFGVPFGPAHVFYPEAGDERCTAALLLDVDPVGLVRRGGGRGAFALAAPSGPRRRRWVDGSAPGGTRTRGLPVDNRASSPLDHEGVRCGRRPVVGAAPDF